LGVQHLFYFLEKWSIFIDAVYFESSVSDSIHQIKVFSYVGWVCRNSFGQNIPAKDILAEDAEVVETDLFYQHIQNKQDASDNKLLVGPSK